MIDKILIHVCCADCLLNTINALEAEERINEQTQLILYFYNPNIHPRSEYMERLKAVKTVIENLKAKRNIKLVIPDYRPKEYFDAINNQPNRCIECWKLRLTEAFRYAQNNDISYVTTTLLSSHYQDEKVITSIAKEKELEHLHFIPLKQPCEHICTHGFYKQNYCGCCYSLTQKLWEKYKG